MQGVTKPATPGQKATLSVQVTADIKNRIDTAARADGCSQGAEITKIINWWFGFQDRFGGPRVLSLLSMLADVAATKFPEGGWLDDQDKYLTVCGLWRGTLNAFVPPRADAAQFVIDIGRILIKALATAEGHEADQIRRQLRSTAAAPLMPEEVKAEFLAAAGTEEEFPETPWRDDELPEELRPGRKITVRVSDNGRPMQTINRASSSPDSLPSKK
jgi:hypothetical protein